ncbi:NUDIX domain-containing protein [Ornithinibacillus halotolerans]|uniref:ADP-ribose pyrophosphatase n=1 Tax=Ornithinibacillus halotolerans TaxID=1274357 RepID=A0A916RN72_9BACI|nr:NUDIX domain-containing protein [Ornithinibacillus halotolerans]GGA60444.1 ADP-ribose pyrophosphatase [Ornithinibacillus halotolerans]
MQIRSSVQAVIVMDDNILTIKKRAYDNKTMYILPGGGQEHGETLRDAVIRECVEETGLIVEPKELLFVSEYIGKNHQHAAWDAHVHVVVHLFRCSLVDESGFNQGTEQDAEQVSLEWIPLDKLSSYDFYPKKIVPSLISALRQEHTPEYVGDMG